MDAALPRYVDGDDAASGAETFHNPMIKAGTRRRPDAPLPPRGGGGGGGGAHDAADKTTCSRTTSARAFLAIGIVLEVSATLWAFQQAVSAGALYGESDCSDDGRLSKTYINAIFEDTCKNRVGEMEPDLFLNNTDHFEGYVGCTDLAEYPTDEPSFEERCTCYGNTSVSPCSWVAISDPYDDICYAQGATVFYDNDGSVSWIGISFGTNCWPSHPIGTVELTMAALAVALSSQLLEALVGFKYWKDTETRTAPALAVSIFEALGVLGVSSVLLTLPGLYTVSEHTPDRIVPFFWLAWAAAASVVVGALVEITSACSDRAAGRVVGAVGNGLIWLGAATIEIVVTSYLLWTADGFRVETRDVVRQAFGLFVLELLGLVAMWIARGLWTRAKILKSSVAKGLELSLRKSGISMSSSK